MYCTSCGEALCSRQELCCLVDKAVDNDNGNTRHQLQQLLINFISRFEAWASRRGLREIGTRHGGVGAVAWYPGGVGRRCRCSRGRWWRLVGVKVRRTRRSRQLGGVADLLGPRSEGQ